ncbi:MAG: hypothetical protein ACREM2_08510, partial [Vulcanimicrobiaceae bacterium]
MLYRTPQLASLLLFARIAALPVAGATATSVDTPLDTMQIDRILAAAHAAAGGAQLERFAGQTTVGSVVQGGAPFSFTNTADLRNGFSRSQAVIGPATVLEGFDGAQEVVPISGGTLRSSVAIWVLYHAAFRKARGLLVSARCT